MSDPNELPEVPAPPTELEQSTLHGDEIMRIVRAVEDVVLGEPRPYVVAALLAISTAAYRPDLVAGEGVADCVTGLSEFISTYVPGQQIVGVSKESN